MANLLRQGSDERGGETADGAADWRAGGSGLYVEFARGGVAGGLRKVRGRQVVVWGGSHARAGQELGGAGVEEQRGGGRRVRGGGEMGEGFRSDTSWRRKEGASWEWWNAGDGLGGVRVHGGGRGPEEPERANSDVVGAGRGVGRRGGGWRRSGG